MVKQLDTILLCPLKNFEKQNKNEYHISDLKFILPIDSLLFKSSFAPFNFDWPKKGKEKQAREISL